MLMDPLTSLTGIWGGGVAEGPQEAGDGASVPQGPRPPPLEEKSLVEMGRQGVGEALAGGVC